MTDSPTTQSLAGPGHNSGETEEKNTSALRLKSFIERIERLNSERKNLGADIREIFAEAKSAGYDPKIMRKTIQLRAMDAAERQEQEALIEVYMNALA